MTIMSVCRLGNGVSSRNVSQNTTAVLVKPTTSSAADPDRGIKLILGTEYKQIVQILLIISFCYHVRIKTKKKSIQILLTLTIVNDYKKIYSYIYFNTYTARPYFIKKYGIQSIKSQLQSS